MILKPEDFKQIPQNGNRFEQLVYQLLEAKGFRVLEEPAVGTDGGIDILIERIVKDEFRTYPEKIVVQCKHRAHGGKSVGEAEINNLHNVFYKTNCQGYLLVTSTYTTENVEETFRQFSENERPKWAKSWNVDKLITELNDYPDIIRVFFDLEPEKLTPLEQLSQEVQIWLNAKFFSTKILSSSEEFVDIQATLHRGLEEQEVVVRCVPQQITVAALKDLEKTFTNKFSKTWVVSQWAVPKNVKEYSGRKNGIRAFSLVELISEIFGNYFLWLKTLIEKDKIDQFYVDLQCYKTVIENNAEVDRDYYEVIDDYIDSWLQIENTGHISILGDFGSGKTWFCRHYAYRQLSRYLKNPTKERLPLLINLRDYAKQIEIGSLVRKLFDEQGVLLNGSLEAFNQLNAAGKLLLIFDGFDEMAVKMDYHTASEYFNELISVVVPGSKALLTCRTGYFRYDKEAAVLFSGEESLVKPSRKKGNLVIQSPKFDVIYLQALTDEQIQEIIIRRSGKETADIILRNSSLRELARQPIVVELLLQILPSIHSYSDFNIADIYELAVNNWLEQDIRTGRTFLDKEQKLFFMRELAWEMFISGNLLIHYRDLPKRINKHFNLEKKADKDYYDYDIRTKSFLRRDGNGYYEFFHKSLVEFLVALKIEKELEKNSNFLKNIFYNKFSGVENAITFDYEDEEDIVSSNESWVVVLSFLWQLKKIGQQKIKTLLEPKIYLQNKILACFLIQALGNSNDSKTIPILLSILVYHYADMEDAHINFYAENGPNLIETLVMEALYKLHYSHYELLVKIYPNYTIEEPPVWEALQTLYSNVAKALLEERIEDAKFLKEEIHSLLLPPYYNVEDFPEIFNDEGLYNIYSDEKSYTPEEFLEVLNDAYNRAEDWSVKMDIWKLQKEIITDLYRRFAEQQNLMLAQLTSPTWSERWKAAYILGDFGDSMAFRVLEDVLNKEGDEAVVKIIKVSMKKISNRKSKNRQVLNYLF